jgi:anti-sigma regulatory factor (Ser/Thr protein kinase)
MALDQRFDADALSGLRKAVLAEAIAAGLPPDRASDVMLAVHELAANAVCHGGGVGHVQLQVTGGALWCQVSDTGGGPPPAGTGVAALPWPVQPGHGLWLVRGLADHLAVAPGPAGSEVTAVFALPGTADGQGERVPFQQRLGDSGADRQ